MINNTNPNEMLERIKNKPPKKELPKKTKVLAGSLVLLLLTGGLGTIIMNNLPKKDQKVDLTVKVEDIKDNQKESTKEVYSVLELPKWAKQPWDELTEETKQEMLKDQENNFLGWTAANLPSEAEGFTSDPTKEFDQDGLPNEFYTSLTKEAFLEEASIAVHRIINPIFGNWEKFQEPIGVNLGDIYSRAYYKLASDVYVTELLNDPSKQSVIYLDQHQNNYNGSFEKDKRQGVYNKFIGVIQNGEVSFDDSGKKVFMTINVDYKTNATTTFQERVLRLQFNLEGQNLILIGGDMSARE